MRIEWAPLRFEPILMEKIWGGQRLAETLAKANPSKATIGESWELSTVPGQISRVVEGPLYGKGLDELLATHGESIMGKRLFHKYGPNFPLLIKFLDANQDLSIQVHPNDALAQARHQSLGKSEMWYVMQAEAPAKLICGFKEAIDPEEFLGRVKRGQILEVLNTEQVQEGDVYYIPAGRIHTIGAGLLIAEIQQSSDVTYRIYDFDRVDKQGNNRELHIQEALAALDFATYPSYKSPYQADQEGRQALVQCPYFQTDFVHLGSKLQELGIESQAKPFTLTVVDGEGVIHWGRDRSQKIKRGEVWLLPVALGEFAVHSLRGIKALLTEVLD